MAVELFLKEHMVIDGKALANMLLTIEIPYASHPKSIGSFMGSQLHYNK